MPSLLNFLDISLSVSNLGTSDLIHNTGQNFKQFLLSLFQRDEFTSQLLQVSIQHPSSWIDIAVVIGIMGLSFWLSQILIRKYLISNNTHFTFLRHLGKRILWPVLMLVITFFAVIVWNVLGFHPLWLRFLLLATQWMILIRTALAIVHVAMPAHKLSGWLERTLASVFWGCFLLWVSGISDIIINWMKGLEFTVGSSTLNLYTIVTGALWVGMIMVLAMWLAKIIQNKLMASTRLDINLRIMLSNIIKTVLMILSVLIALPLVGINLTVLSVFGGALGVGIGFALQKIASNYISGFIILGDRSIRPGDRLTVNNFTGYVTKITSRFVVLRSSAGAEALVPNETFITSMVVNESYTGKSLSQSLDVQVSYSSDIVRALEIMQSCAAAQSRVESTPPPKAYLIGFADNGIDLRVTFWVADPENGFLGLFSAILLDIWKHFNEENIEFPFPQREVRILNEAAEPTDTAILRAGIKARNNTESIDPDSN
ncbi:MAG: mechanosensitive ion channel [Neisseria sp.]|uniref:mechanosensitive ion channel family protein n=1 Tax=Neisseria sp. TaxID=192066 RepID=UPI0026DCFA2C|nr:mechanosensitive ion channel domain-containing protein [Neisseria sp.]MDO4641177.1 mechanosensitive ion channel [Neisseria sp.]